MSRLKQAILDSAHGEINRTGAGEASRPYLFTPDFIGFSGHFPGYPILPAFAQVLTVVVTAEEGEGRPIRVLSIEKAKFRAEIHPGQEVFVQYRIRTAGDKTKLEATVTTDERLSASLLLIIAPEVSKINEKGDN